MSVAASKVKSICTPGEIALVQASRKPELEKLSQAELKRLASRARKLFDKWQGLGRGQSRGKRRQGGASGVDPNTSLKVQIFREALDSFEAQLERASAEQPSRRPRPATKKARTSEHRARRAAIRKGMTAAEDLLNASRPSGKRAVPAKAPPAAKPAAATSKAAKPRASKPRPPVMIDLTAAGTSSLKQLEAATAAKQARIARSGKTARQFGHLLARGKRAQARRDAKR